LSSDAADSMIQLGQWLLSPEYGDSICLARPVA
jgi:hypothetical protein